MEVWIHKLTRGSSLGPAASLVLPGPWGSDLFLRRALVFAEEDSSVTSSIPAHLCTRTLHPPCQGASEGLVVHPNTTAASTGVLRQK